MVAIVRRRDDVFVVDANLDDYAPLVNVASLYEIRVRGFSTGEDALRAVGACPPTLWVVNIRLSDMSGISIVTLVRCRLRRCSMILVGDEYSAEDEVAARTAGATAYVCKPASAAWLETYHARCQSPEIRGPASMRGSPATIRPP